jgi:hypothetical protein
VTEFIGKDLTGSRFQRVNLAGSRFQLAQLSGLAAGEVALQCVDAEGPRSAAVTGSSVERSGRGWAPSGLGWLLCDLVTSAAGLPVELVELFAGVDTSQRSLSVSLPAGRTVRGEEGGGDHPVLWLSDQAAPSGLWPRLHAEHERCGLWPLLLDSLPVDAARPWQDGDLWPARMSSPGQHDAERLLAGWWSDYSEPADQHDPLSPAERLAVTAPYGRRWPGLAPSGQPRTTPAAQADACADALLRAHPAMRLGLVPADRGSDALTAAGWQGAANYTNDTAELSAVLRTWEHRFGARMIGVGFSELHLSIAAPPSTAAEALAVAAEHFAFCPDNIWQGAPPYTLAGYAQRLVDSSMWTFWWD